MRSIFTLLLLGTALFITVSAAPTQLKSSQGPLFNGAKVQTNNEMAQTFMKFFGNALSAFGKGIGDNGEIQSGMRNTNIFSNHFSAVSKNIENNGEIQTSHRLGQRLLDFFDKLIST